jgi:ankyrin repeat protein
MLKSLMAKQPSEDEIDDAFRSRDAIRLWGMLDNGLDPNWRNARGDTLLHSAARMGDLSVVEKLFEKGAKALCFNAEGESPLDTAIIWGNDKTAQMIQARLNEEKLTRGNDPIPYASLQDIRDKAAETGIDPLHDIARRGQFNQVVPLALNDAQGLNAADLLSKGLDGDTVLLKICQHGQLPLLAKPELWVKKPQDFQKIWDSVPTHYRKEVDYDSFVSALRQAKLQSYGKPKLKGFHK